MPSTADALEDQLRSDLRRLDGGRLGDEGFARQLYRALTNRRWAREGDAGAVALSWGQAEALVNTLREEHGHGPLALAGSGGEGWLSDAADDALGETGWESVPVRPAPNEAQRPAGGDSTGRPPVPARRFARRPLRYPSADLMWSRRSHGGAPPQATA